MDGRVVVITGAARGIGRATAVAFAKEGYRVAGADIAGLASSAMDYEPATPEDLAETGSLVEAAGAEWLPVIFDQRDIAAVREGFAGVVERFGGVDVVFANAGIQGFGSLLEMSDQLWNDQIEINLTGTANVLRVAAPLLVERGGGRIIITSSTQGQHGTLDGSGYSASKWGLIGLMKSAALDLGPHGITVNAVIPGLINTALTRHEDRYAQMIRTGGSEPTGNVDDDERTAAAASQKKLPLGVPWIEPEDVAPLVVFLASDAARMVSGTSFAATGGDSANITA
ncbi:SDR family NAD(P)-dependent oxidoreductase [Leifsonia aquatica]|uniref:NAD(P)-dependent dehydrogenase (Short-subunit alcohol dehydrogenase family) n=2 Tax=Leifsonia aquatica TaxID=144185 RepID=A0A7W4YIF7_LEIAQ|nr:SDR family NAD(P)-dependent oxidoreductase [Leifsonia aquatica]ERK71036.1 putative (-)-trans-carveol dehydrogenase [Leifsonia aquatica ATCC 14665]MBB2965604.1 NAD(P)-dependent dehydrogenase (short-subunit alcohol dehydrogenase family) [Leifsonia aquatica]